MHRSRVQLILDKDLYSWIKSESKRKAISLSLAIRDVLRKEYDEWMASQELLSDSSFMKAYYKGVHDVINQELVEWRKARKDV